MHCIESTNPGFKPKISGFFRLRKQKICIPSQHSFLDKFYSNSCCLRGSLNARMQSVEGWSRVHPCSKIGQGGCALNSSAAERGLRVRQVKSKSSKFSSTVSVGPGVFQYQCGRACAQAVGYGHQGRGKELCCRQAAESSSKSGCVGESEGGTWREGSLGTGLRWVETGREGRAVDLRQDVVGLN